MEISNEETELWHEKVMNWCDEQIDRWTRHMKEKNSPFYHPMLFLYTKDDHTFSNMLVDELLSDMIPTIQPIIEMLEQEHEKEIIGILYFFHTNPEEEPPSKQFVVKRTTLRFHLFSKFQEEMLAHSNMRVILYEGQLAEKDVLYIEPLEEKRYLATTIEILTKNPFFM